MLILIPAAVVAALALVVAALFRGTWYKISLALSILSLLILLGAQLFLNPSYINAGCNLINNGCAGTQAKYFIAALVALCVAGAALVMSLHKPKVTPSKAKRSKKKAKIVPPGGVRHNILIAVCAAVLLAAAGFLLLIAFLSSLS